MEFLLSIKWSAVAIATFVSFVFGFVYYHPAVLGQAWANGAGVELGQPSTAAIVGTFLGNLAAALGIVFVLQIMGEPGQGLLSGLYVGALLAILVITPAIIGQWLFMGKPQLFAVNFGYNLSSMALTGAILGAMSPA